MRVVEKVLEHSKDTYHTRAQAPVTQQGDPYRKFHLSEATGENVKVDCLDDTMALRNLYYTNYAKFGMVHASMNNLYNHALDLASHTSVLSRLFLAPPESLSTMMVGASHPLMYHRRRP